MNQADIDALTGGNAQANRVPDLWLAAVGGIEDREAAHAEGGRTGADDARVVGAPVELRGEHAAEGGLADGGRMAKGDEAGDAAHGGRERGARSREPEKAGVGRGGAAEARELRGCGGRR